jgi:lipoprotein-anchoring transpeptidase ErfK/SrfK
MADYYSILLRAVTAPGAGDAQWRRGIYDRARQMLVTQMLARRPPVRPAEITAEQSALDAAVARIEAELSWTDAHADDGDEAADSRKGDIRSTVAAAPRIEPERQPFAPQSRLSGRSWVVVAIVVAALGALGYVVLSPSAKKSAAPVVKSDASGAAPQAPSATQQAPSPTPQAPSPTRVATSKDGDLAPGVDGGASDPDQAYVLRRQSTFYRTLQPVGTIIVDKLQHYLYLIQPNNVAVRYGIGVGDQCKDLAGLKHIAGKAEWPQWQPPPDIIKRTPPVMPGGPGNPLGARVLELDDNNSRINGTNAPKTIGSTVIFGCIRLVNDDIVDLYNRAKVGTPVVVN